MYYFGTGVFFAWACATAEQAMCMEAHHRVCLHQNGASQSYHSDYFARWSWRMCSWFNKMCSLQNKKLYRAPNNNKQPCSCQTSLRNLLFHLVQRISLHFKSTDLYLFCTTKVFPKFLLPFQSQASFQSEQFGSYDYAARSLSLVACSLTSQRSRMLMQKRPLF